MTTPNNSIFGTESHFKVADASALAVLIRYTESTGCRVTMVRPINDYFVITVDGNICPHSCKTLRPYAAGVDRNREYFGDIIPLMPSAVEFLCRD